MASLDPSYWESAGQSPMYGYSGIEHYADSPRGTPSGGGWTASWDPGSQGYYYTNPNFTGGFAANLNPIYTPGTATHGMSEGTTTWQEGWLNRQGRTIDGTPTGWMFRGVTGNNGTYRPVYGVDASFIDNTGGAPVEWGPPSYSGIGYDHDISDNLYEGDSGYGELIDNIGSGDPPGDHPPGDHPPGSGDDPPPGSGDDPGGGYDDPGGVYDPDPPSEPGEYDPTASYLPHQSYLRGTVGTYMETEGYGQGADYGLGGESEGHTQDIGYSGSANFLGMGGGYGAFSNLPVWSGQSANAPSAGGSWLPWSPDMGSPGGAGDVAQTITPWSGQDEPGQGQDLV